MLTSISNRVNTLLLVLILAVGIALVAMLASGAHGGPLDPPGPPASTDAVRDPGTPISSLPYTITSPGYYYVTRPLTGTASQNGVTILTSNVTLDLGGFTVGGGPSPGNGIDVGAFRNVVIRNGAVRGWQVGISAELAGNSRVDHMQVSSNNLDGIRLGPGSEINNCNASLNGGSGIVGHNIVVRMCTTTENAAGIDVGGTALVEDNRVSGNTGHGIGLYGDNDTVRNNELSGNAGTDIFVISGSGHVLRDNVYCTIVNFATNTSITNNVDRTNAC